MNRFLLVVLYGVLLTACSGQLPPPMDPSPGHIRPDAVPPAAAAPIPAPVTIQPILPAPRPAPRMETYTVVVSEVPAKELLFALARDANMNVDIHPGITGDITLNAIDQTLPQILERLSRQIDLRYELEGNNLAVMPDLPFFRTYKVDYLNISRETTSSMELNSNLSSGSGLVENQDESLTKIKDETVNEFWKNVVANILAILGLDATEQFYTLEKTKKEVTDKSETSEKGKARQDDYLAFSSKEVVANATAGVISVLATYKQHQTIQEYLDIVLASARRQVLIEATIVEVTLNDDYESGVDWNKFTSQYSLLQANAGAALTTAAFGGVTAATGIPFFVFDYNSNQDPTRGVQLTVRLLKQFGETRVLSSPKLMSLNNQTSVLKVVDNEVFFTIDVSTTTTDGAQTTTFESNLHTVAVGVMMTVTPLIGDDDSVILKVRPTVSRVTGTVNDPNPDLAAAGVTSPIPVIQTREMESVLKVNNGQVAVLGGLMQDAELRSNSGIPGLSGVDTLGELFKHRNSEVTKSELIVFIRPVVIREPSIDKDLRDFRPFLQKSTQKVTKKTQPEQPR